MSTAAASFFIIPLVTGCHLGPIAVKGEETSPRIESNKADDDNSGVLGAIQSFFDPNEKTKSGKTLPKSYLKSVKEVVKTLKESLQEDSNDVAKFRRSADAARESIGEFLNGWRGQPSVSSEESYVALEKAIRTLAGFYSKNGPLAPMPDTIKSDILNDLDTAEAFL